MDNILGNDYAGTSAMGQYDNPKMAHMPTMKQRLEMAVVQAEEKLKQAKRAREILNNNPELEELLNILQRGGF